MTIPEFSGVDEALQRTRNGASHSLWKCLRAAKGIDDDKLIFNPEPIDGLHGASNLFKMPQMAPCLYTRAQHAITELKGTVYELLAGAQEGLTNAEIGRTLGIYQGHIGHEGHVSRTVLAQLEAEEVVVQDKTSKRWRLKKHSSESAANETVNSLFKQSDSD